MSKCHGITKPQVANAHSSHIDNVACETSLQEMEHVGFHRDYVRIRRVTTNQSKHFSVCRFDAITADACLYGASDSVIERLFSVLIIRYPGCAKYSGNRSNGLNPRRRICASPVDKMGKVASGCAAYRHYREFDPCFHIFSY